MRDPHIVKVTTLEIKKPLKKAFGKIPHDTRGSRQWQAKINLYQMQA